MVLVQHATSSPCCWSIVDQEHHVLDNFWEPLHFLRFNYACCSLNSVDGTGNEIVVEEFLDGEEASFFALVDGETCVALGSAQVKLPASHDDRCSICMLLIGRSFDACISRKVLIEERAVQDHKAVGEGDTGPNTGGMGAYSPAPVVTSSVESQVALHLSPSHS